jgi:hypothetical protein
MSNLKLLAAAAGLLFAATGVRADGPPDLTLDLPAGVACPGFDLRIEIWSPDHRVSRSFTARNGYPRLLNAGQGNTLVFTDLNTGAKLTVPTDGSVESIKLLPDGTQRWTVTGHNAIVWFPTDIPPGPATIVYSGRVSFSVDASGGVSTLGKTAGTSFDVCRALVS